jgi:hypothetical protein
MEKTALSRRESGDGQILNVTKDRVFGLFGMRVVYSG